MVRVFPLVCTLTVLFGWGLPHASSQTPERASMHVQLVMDTSGSMKTNDGERLSALAGMIFTDLAAPGDYLGIQSMKTPRPTLKSLSRVEQSRDALRRVAETIPFKGGTYCEPPLAAARRELAAQRKKDAAARQFVIFFSDGLCQDAVEEASARLRDDGVTIFSVGLFDQESLESDQDPEAALRLMKNITGGEYLRVESANQLPKTFAQVLGRIIGSEARPVELKRGETPVVIDPYVLDAMLVVTHESRPVRVTRLVAPDKSAVDVPVKSVPYTAEGDSYFVSAAGMKARHYTVVRLEDPAAGEWRLILDGAEQAEAILVQNYALSPVLELRPDRDTFQVGEPLEIILRLRETNGDWIDDADFASRVDVRIEVEAPTTEERPKVERDGAQFKATFTPEQQGPYVFRAVASMQSGLNKSAKPLEARAVEVELALASQDPVDFGTVKGGDQSDPVTIELNAPELDIEYPLELEFSGDDKVESTRTRATITRTKPEFETAFAIDRTHPGGAVEGVLAVRFGSTKVDVAVRGTVEPLTFWEVWGDLILTVGFGLLILLLLGILIYGWISPYSFPANARFVVTRKRGRIEKSYQFFKDIPGTGKFFFRNARLKIGGTTAMSIGVDTCIATLEAGGPAGIRLSVSDGYQLEREVKFSDGEFEVIESGEVAMKTDRLYRVDDFFIAVK